MGGITTRLQGKMDYTMLATNFAANKSMQITVARRISVERWREAIMMARVHAVTPYNAGAVITLMTQPDPYTDEDPGVIWKVPSAAGAQISWTQGTDNVPQAKQLPLVAPFGPLILVIWQFTMATTPVDTTISVSIDLNLKGQ